MHPNAKEIRLPASACVCLRMLIYSGEAHPNAKEIRPPSPQGSSLNIFFLAHTRQLASGFLRLIVALLPPALLFISQVKSKVD
jgi:hypothetical protein